MWTADLSFHVSARPFVAATARFVAPAIATQFRAVLLNFDFLREQHFRSSSRVAVGCLPPFTGSKDRAGCAPEADSRPD